MNCLKSIDNIYHNASLQVLQPQYSLVLSPVLIPEPVTIPDALELIHDDFCEQLSRSPICLQHACRPDVYIIGTVVIQFSKPLYDLKNESELYAVMLMSPSMHYDLQIRL